MKRKVVWSKSYRGDIAKTQMRRYAEKWEGLPLPRLQMRWAEKPVPKSQVDHKIALADDEAWDCFYELVLPVDKWDIRNEKYGAGFILVPIGHSRRYTANPPCHHSGTDDPFRDSAHAFMDSRSLGWLPIYVVAPDGTAIRKLTYFDQPAEWTLLRDRDLYTCLTQSDLGPIRGAWNRSPPRSSTSKP